MFKIGSIFCLLFSRKKNINVGLSNARQFRLFRYMENKVNQCAYVLILIIMLKYSSNSYRFFYLFDFILIGNWDINDSQFSLKFSFFFPF